jgi:hypothetical protein
LNTLKTAFIDLFPGFEVYFADQATYCLIKSTEVLSISLNSSNLIDLKKAEERLKEREEHIKELTSEHRSEVYRLQQIIANLEAEKQ